MGGGVIKGILWLFDKVHLMGVYQRNPLVIWQGTFRGKDVWFNKKKASDDFFYFEKSIEY